MRNAQRETYTPVECHWFYKQMTNGRDSWEPFSTTDSQRLEERHTHGGDDEVVATQGKRYDVKLKERLRYAVFWDEPPSEVRRCSWFYISNMAKFIPCSEESSQQLEEAFMTSVTSNEWNRSVTLPTGETFNLHHPEEFTTPEGTLNFNCPPLPCERTLKRGVENICVEIPQGEPDRVDHLVFMVHGFGEKIDIVQCVNAFRSNALTLIKSHFSSSDENSSVGRVEFLPVNWNRVIQGKISASGYLELQSVGLQHVLERRYIGNNRSRMLMNTLLYVFPRLYQDIVDTVGSQIYHLYSIFVQRNPEFTGAVSVAGHGIGSVILFDLLTNQQTGAESTSAAQAHTGNTDERNSPEIASLSRESHPTTSTTDLQYSDVRTGQVWTNYQQLNFHLHTFFAFGSQLGYVLLTRGVNRIDPNYNFPTCPSFYNILHPCDPVAFRMEHLILAPGVKLAPVLMSHHKGRKRMHLELKEGLRHIIDLLGFSAVPQKQVEDIQVGRLNGGRRVDYVLQERPVEYLCPYLYDLQSHWCYWWSEDTALQVLNEIYHRNNLTTTAKIKCE